MPVPQPEPQGPRALGTVLGRAGLLSGCEEQDRAGASGSSPLKAYPVQHADPTAPSEKNQLVSLNSAAEHTTTQTTF